MKQKIIRKILQYIFKYYRKNYRNFFPRYWSNDELKKISHFFRGDLLHVSAGKDLDKEGKEYKTYFNNIKNYFITNHKLEYSNDDTVKEFYLNLEEDLPENLCNRKFDVVFSHTVLEHIFKIDKAIDNLTMLSDDIIITIVPFIQSYHAQEHFNDFWRFSPFALKKMFENKGFTTIYVSWNEDILGNIYVFHVCSSKPQKWNNITNLYNITKTDKGPGYLRAKAISNNTIQKDCIINNILD